MAFVPALTSHRLKSYTRPSLSPSTVPRVSTLRMVDEPATKTDSPVFGKAGKSMWKENVFTGGFPGGEQFYLAWSEDGMTKDVPDVPESMQSKTEYTPSGDGKKGGVLGMLDATEFFKTFVGQEIDDEVETVMDPETGEMVPAPVEPVEEVEVSEEPDQSLYDSYYPPIILNLAPHIDIAYSGDKVLSLKDKVTVTMKEVTASYTDLYYPKDFKNKAPIIDIFYNGSLKSAYVSLKMEHIAGLPTLPPTPNVGDAVATLVPGNGGGLKLDITINE